MKNVKFTEDVRDFTSYNFKPQLKTVGPKYGKMLGGIKAALDSVDGNAAMDELNAEGSLKLDVNGQEITLFPHRSKDMYPRMTTASRSCLIRT